MDPCCGRRQLTPIRASGSMSHAFTVAMNVAALGGQRAQADSRISTSGQGRRQWIRPDSVALAALCVVKPGPMSPEELRERLGRAGLTPYRLSYLLGVEPNEGSKWTRGDRPVPKGRVAQIIELTDFVAANGAAAVPLPSLVRTVNVRPRLAHPAVTRPETCALRRPIRNCNRRLGPASARFTPTSFALTILQASAACVALFPSTVDRLSLLVLVTDIASVRLFCGLRGHRGCRLRRRRRPGFLLNWTIE
jgi:hypothetical protein